MANVRANYLDFILMIIYNFYINFITKFKARIAPRLFVVLTI